MPLEWSATVTATLPTSSWIGDDADQWQIPLEWSCLVEADPGPDASPPPFIEQASFTMPAPTYDPDNGRPDATWLPSIAYSDWGQLQLVVGGRSLTTIRGALFFPLTDSHVEPFGDESASFAFPGLTEFDDPADYGLVQFAAVTFRYVDPDGHLHTLFEGEIASLEPDTGNGPQIDCVGTNFRLDLLKQPPALAQTAKDYGQIIAAAFNDKRRRFNMNLGYMATVNTGLTGTQSADDFKPFLTGAMQDYLAEMTTDAGDQWTIVLARPRTPKLALKDTTAVHATISYGAPGVSVQLSKDYTTGVTAVYGSGSNGHCTWMGARFPNLVQGDVPTFPLAVGHVFVAGDGQTGFAEFSAFLRRGQYGTIVSGDTYDARDFDNVEQFQDRAGITVDGIVGAQTWEAAFQPGFNQGSITGAYVDTIWEKTATRRRLYNAQGADVGANPAYDPNVPRVEDYVPFGDNVSKSLGTKSASQIVSRAYPAGWVGMIELESDPAEISRWAMHSGMNVQVNNFRGGSLLVHSNRVERDWENGRVRIFVDEKARDLLTAAAIHQREKDVSDRTRRQQFGRVRSKVFNDYGTWLCEDGAGEIPLMNQQGGFWNVQRIAAAPKGSIARISLAAGTGLTESVLNHAVDHTISSVPGAARAAMLIFTGPVTPRSINSLTGMSTPLTALGDGTNPVDHNQDALNTLGLIYAAGGPGQAMGFYPNNDPGDGSSTNLTGMTEDGGGIDFGPTGYYWLWVAIWTPTSCKVGGRIFPGPPA